MKEDPQSVLDRVKNNIVAFRTHLRKVASSFGLYVTKAGKKEVFKRKGHLPDFEYFICTKKSDIEFDPWEGPHLDLIDCLITGGIGSENYICYKRKGVYNPIYVWDEEANDWRDV